jgi:hypothetical protein
MEYILKINDTKEAKSLISFLRSLKFVKLLDIDSEIKEKEEAITLEEIKSVIHKAEDSPSIPLINAIEISSKWKNKRK